MVEEFVIKFTNILIFLLRTRSRDAGKVYRRKCLTMFLNIWDKRGNPKQLFRLIHFITFFIFHFSNLEYNYLIAQLIWSHIYKWKSYRLKYKNSTALYIQLKKKLVIEIKKNF